MSDVCWLDATELAARIRAKQLSPVEVVRAHLERITAVNPTLNAVVTLIDAAETQAHAAEAAVMHGDAIGPLHGVPFTVKDCVDTAGTRTTRGSRLFADHVPAADATVVARWKAVGGIPIAKTNLPEFALWWETGNLLFGRTVNPWNPERTTGGSSGGEAAAIAAGCSPLGIGSDVGGSIRLPAHYCGIAGLKPTHGRVPLTGHWPETLLSFMHVGPMARTVRDIALGLALMAGPDGHDWHAPPVPVPDLSDADVALPPLRIGWLAEHGFGPVDRDVAATVARAADALKARGCRVEPVRIPGLEARDGNLLTMTVFAPTARAYFAPIIAGREAELTPVLRRRIGGPLPSVEEYAAAEGEVEGLRRDLAAYFRQYDVLLCPTTIVPAHPHEQAACLVDGQALPPRQVVRATAPFDLTGSPALSVPFGWSRERLPIGVQVVGRDFDEATVLRVGLALEAQREPGPARPPV
jgi:aspartyl-tRNA(Asn)/glutamyl-tRNA(Gln) amidotransferase subunit A